MSGVAGVGAPVDPLGRQPTGERERLKNAARQLEAQFITQLLQALRDTVPDSTGSAGMGQGKAMFTDLLDERIADDMASRLHRGLGEAIYRQLVRDAGLDAPDVAPEGI